MTAFDFEALVQKHGRYIDVFVGILVAGGIIGLLVLDISSPRGAADSVGYAALVALSVRLGWRMVLGAAAVTSLLTIGSAFLVPDAGILVAVMWINRILALAAIWIVATILLRRLRLETYIAARERALRDNQAALGTILHEALLSEKSRVERAQCITELSAAAMGCDLCAILQIEDTKTFRTVDVWDRKSGRHFLSPDALINSSPAYRGRMEKEFVVYADDVLKSPMHEAYRESLQALGVRAVLEADTLLDNPGLGSIAFGFRTPHRWTAEDIALARSVGNIVALLFTVQRNSDIVATLDQVSEGVYAEDRDGIVQYANQVAKALSWRDPGDKHRRFPRPPEALSGASDLREVRHNEKDLEIRRVRLPNGGLLARIYDVTARNTALAERQKYEARLQQSAKMEAIGQLAGGVAHDFNNILGAIMGFAGLLAQDLPKQSDQRKFAGRILNACERGTALVEQILAFARARVAERGVVDLGVLLKRNSEYLGDLMPPNVAITLSIADTGLPIAASETQVSQLVANLCLNARDALKDKGGAIEISAQPVPAEKIEDRKTNLQSMNERLFGEWQEDAHYCVLRIKDNGPGIAPHILDRVFEPFFTTKGRQRGTGLGLAVVHGVVRSACGVCHLSSTADQGTVFSIYFPIARHGGTSHSATATAEVRGSERILIVDDEPDIADMLVIGLERLGYETVGVSDPLEALAAFAEQPDAFDVVITDQVMPGMRGLDLIRRMKEIKPRIKVILCTGYSDGANAEVAYDAGADVFFHKPVNPLQIASRIRDLMKTKTP